MRPKLNTRFPAARIKKIMQSNDDIGKIAKAVPLLISKALELFLQDLCDLTYDITLTRGANAVSSLHLKQCVEKFVVLNFLRAIVRKVPDLGGSSAVTDDRRIGRRRKFADLQDQNARKESESKTVRGRKHRRGCRAIEKDIYEDDPDISDLTSEDYEADSIQIKHNTTRDENTSASLRNFNLNLELSENDNGLISSVEGSNDTAGEFDQETVDDKIVVGYLEKGRLRQNDPILFSCLNQVTADDKN